VSEDAPAPGDIVWIDFSPTVGTEQAGRRPALVLSEASYNRAAGRALVAPITSRIRDWPFEVAIPPGSPITGVALVDQVRIIDWRARNAKPAGAAPAATLDEARAKLGALIGRP
jgi:mRNA interferase MazF